MKPDIERRPVMNYEEDYRKCSKIAREASRYARLQMKNWELGSGESDCLAEIRKHPGWESIRRR